MDYAKHLGLDIVTLIHFFIALDYGEVVLATIYTIVFLVKIICNFSFLCR
jgi:hypothetical protein